MYEMAKLNREIVSGCFSVEPIKSEGNPLKEIPRIIFQRTANLTFWDFKERYAFDDVL